jgi:tetratricopeptide (TPR) repeat protein
VAGIIGTTVGLVWAVLERDERGKALVAEKSARAAERQARDKAMAALRALTDEIVEQQMARGTTLTLENKEFLRKIIAQFEGFAGITSDDTESRAIRAEGHFRVGRMQDRLGEPKDAETSYAAALAEYKQLVTAFPDRPEFLQGLGRCYDYLGSLFEDTRQFKEAEDAYAAAFALRSQLAARFPAEPEYRRELAGTYGNQGTLLKRAGRLKEAEVAYRAALAIFTRLVADFPKRLEFRQELALSHDNIGLLLRAQDQLNEAAEAHAAGIAIQKQLVAEVPTKPEFRQELARSQSDLGGLKWFAGDLTAAKSAWTDAIATQKRLAAEFPTLPDYRMELAHSYNNLANVSANTHQLPEAETSYRAALELWKQLAADFPTRPDFRQYLAATLGNLGYVFEATDRLKETEEAYTAAVAINKQLAAEFADQPDLRNELSSALGNLAFFHLERRDFETAKSLLDEALPHHEAALKASPANPTYRSSYRNNRGALIDVCAGLGDQAGAIGIAQQLRDLGWDPGADAYDAARDLSLCIPIVAKNEKASQEERDKQAAFYGDGAVKMLRDAVAKGFKDADRMKNDNGLDALRQRDDFKKLLTELEASTRR